MMTGDEIVRLSRKHTIFEWTAQESADPVPVARAKGIYFWTPEGKRFIDFNSQLMCVNIGHGDPRVLEAIQKQAAVLTYVTPSMTTEPRARLYRPAEDRLLLSLVSRRHGRRDGRNRRAAGLVASAAARVRPRAQSVPWPCARMGHGG